MCCYRSFLLCCFFFFFNDTATTEIYTLSLHDALPIWLGVGHVHVAGDAAHHRRPRLDRKSTRLSSSHANISYAVFCLKKKKKNVNSPLHNKKKNIIQNNNKKNKK